ncbi:type II toxin-antitoxin system RelE/ParE family toxin [Phyllobacterium leguminum]|uniref:Proteic killer suppression protein n=1 Tax=Phyllobacterium leguminum TaxID=314237 RepID=A0A318T352_9HYPH|nr:type II toxin-antitoxin system RelE/ParE family toxin [Phyllobacterium leguminum]PYE88455.1 proteic killer suppression protein [Phyllobacterium leguminum]
MIESFRSKPLKRYWTKGDDAGIRPDWRKKIRIILSRLDAVRDPAEMNVPGFGFHALKGDQTGRFAVSVSRNWRITFSWEGENATDVEMEDYHGD